MTLMGTFFDSSSLDVSAFGEPSMVLSFLSTRV